MRRLLLVGVVSVLSVLGFGAAYVLAGGLNSKQNINIRLCHSGSGQSFTLINPSSLGALNGHVKNDPLDIIPPFVIVDNGTEVSFPGRNMDHIYAGATPARRYSRTTASFPTSRSSRRQRRPRRPRTCRSPSPHRPPL